MLPYARATFRFFVSVLIIYLTSIPMLVSLEEGACQDSQDSKCADPEAAHASETNFTVDPNGYVLFCLCMGRFGNQVEHFLGGLAAVKKHNRTLILPSWRTYRNVRFDELFKVQPLQDYHRVIVAEDFMEFLAPTVWPKQKRYAFCVGRKPEEGCKMKEGNPFGPFWDGLGVDFVRDIINDYSMFSRPERFNEEYPADLYPVIAMRGAPANYPMREENRHLQQYLQWSDALMQNAKASIERLFGSEKFIGIHLRNGKDWENGCKTGIGMKNFMASTQCFGTASYKGAVTQDVCLPPEEEVVRLVRKVLQDEHIKFVYVATDKNPMLREIKEGTKDMDVTVVHLDPYPPQIDLIILGQAEHFIGNCVSSFSSFVKRERDVTGKKTSFFGFTKKVL